MATSDETKRRQRINETDSPDGGGNAVFLKNEAGEEADIAEHPLFSSPYLSGSQEGATASDLLRQKKQSDQGDLADVGLNAGIGAAKAGKMTGEGIELAGTGMQAGGKVMQGGGQALQATGKGVSAAGKGVRAAGQATAEGGSAIMDAGVDLSATGYGAIIGVPLAIAGGAVAGVGYGAQGAGEALDVGGQAMSEAGVGIQEAGKGVEEAGKGVKKAGKEVKDFSGKAEDTLHQVKGQKDKAKGFDEQFGFPGLPEGFGSIPGLEMPGKAGKNKKGKIEQLKNYVDMFADLGAPTAGGEAETSDELRQKKQKAHQGHTPEAGGKGLADMSGMKKAPSLDQMGSLWKQARALQQGGGALDQVKGITKQAANMGMQMVTGELLKQSWLNIIDSWGLTIIYINFHAFCTLVFDGKYFCPLGAEWAEGGKAAGSFCGIPLTEKVIGFLEMISLILLDLLVAALILISCLPYIIILIIVHDPASAFGTLMAAFADIAKLLIR